MKPCTNNYFTFIVMLVIFYSCAYQRVSFVSYRDHEKNKYTLKLPSGFSFYQSSYEHGTYHDYKYKDGSIVSLSDDLTSGIYEKEVEKKYGSDTYLRIILDDNANIVWQDSISHFNRIKRLKGIRITYINVPIAARQALFDSLFDIAKVKHYPGTY